MSNKVKTGVLAKKLDVSTATIARLQVRDSKFPQPQKIGRDKYYCTDLLHDWLESRSTNPSSLQPDDRIVSGVRVLEMTKRSRVWLWQNAIKSGNLTRINLSPDPKSNKLINYFIEREIRAAFGDLIEVAATEASQ